MSIERKGNTLHLLKQKSKAVPQERKRRKISLAGTPQQWNEANSQPNSQVQKPVQVQPATMVEEEVKVEEPIEVDNYIPADDYAPRTGVASKRERKKPTVL